MKEDWKNIVCKCGSIYSSFFPTLNTVRIMLLYWTSEQKIYSNKLVIQT